MALWIAVLYPGAVFSSPQYQGPTNSPHGSLKLACQQCHTTTSWWPLRPFPEFNHNDTSYPLQGKHKRVDCRLCHVKPVFSNVGRECVSCHADIHRRQLGSDCSECHDESGWRRVAYEVNAHENRFPLLGAHRTTECESCHRSAAVGLFRGLSTDCAFCHMEDFLNAKSIDHVAAGFSTQCQDCHGFDSWAQGFDHALNTGFALTGAHAPLDCVECHVGGKFTGTPAECVGCHLDVFNAATNPNHIASGFPQDCSVCHSTAAWTPAVFDHNQTQFPLTGAHAALQCLDCHASGQYAGLPTACAACHLDAFNAATDPNHVSAGFPQDCSVCHSTAAWTPAVFDHNATRFPLTGAHTGVQCQDCHIGGVYAGTPTDCYSCHSSEFNSVTDPNHVTAAFPHDCSQCHTTSTWSGAEFDHLQFFPIYSGTHAGRWSACSDCHTNSNNYSVFSCITCHEHDQATTDPQHGGVSNYVYNATSCYACHPTGRGED